MSKMTALIATMSSLEIVDLINEDRKAEAEATRKEFRVLRHDHFMAKLEKHPGIDGPKFRGIYRDSLNREKPCYHLPKREAELMVMSESLKVQTRVYDRLVALEAKAEDRQLVRNDTRAGYRLMSGMVEMQRESIGKLCRQYHFSNEALMLNEILFGERKAIDRDSLSVEDLAKLAKLEMQNAMLIATGMGYADRKAKLIEFAKRLATMLLSAPAKTKQPKGGRGLLGGA